MDNSSYILYFLFGCSKMNPLSRRHSLGQAIDTKRRFWTEKEKHFLETTREAAFAFHWLHERASRYYMRMFNYIALPAYLIHLLVAGGAVSNLQSGGSQWIQACTVVFATVGMLLKAVDDTKQFKQRANEHQSAATQFSELARAIRRESCKPENERQEATTFLAAMDDRYSQLKQIASHIPEHVVCMYETMKRTGEFEGGFEGGIEDTSKTPTTPNSSVLVASFDSYKRGNVMRRAGSPNLPVQNTRQGTQRISSNQQNELEQKGSFSIAKKIFQAPSKILTSKPKRPLEILIERSVQS